MKTLLLSLMMTTVAYGQVSSVEIKNFNFNYQAPQGDGTADAFSYQKSTTQSQKVHIEKVGEDFKIQLEGVENQEFSFSGAPDLIKNADSIKLAAFNLSFSDKVSMTLASAKFQSPDQNVDLNNLNLACDRVAANAEVMDQVIAGCIQKMSFKTSSVSSQGEGFDQAIMKAIDESHDEITAAMGVKNVDFKIAAGKFSMSADVKAQISGTVKGNGTVQYDVAAKKLTVKISEVKFGILDLTSKVFDELKKQESASIKVNKPYVYITIK